MRTKNSRDTIKNDQFDYVVVGAGIIGLTAAFELNRRYPAAKIAVIEKETAIAQHASGRNSGVLHAGFYYTADSLKAKFCRDGNRAIQSFCREHGLAINPCGKLVVAKNEEELKGLEELKRRGDLNGVPLEWKSESEAARIDPNVAVYKKALWSPSTATVDPIAVCEKLKSVLEQRGVRFIFNSIFEGRSKDGIVTNNGSIDCSYLVNCAGLYADSIARHYGFAKDRVVMPFKGIYSKSSNKEFLRTNVYPVPNLGNPFLGVHFTVTVDGQVKIGPTAIPAFWRENYAGFSRFSFKEFIETAYWQLRLLVQDAFGFRSLAWTEIKKYYRPHFLDLGRYLVKSFSPGAFSVKVRSGIRAQLLNTKTLELVQDFEIEGDAQSVHVLNAVSPAFTCSFPFATHLVDQIHMLQVKSQR